MVRGSTAQSELHPGGIVHHVNQVTHAAPEIVSALHTLDKDRQSQQAQMGALRVALVHEWYVNCAGSERVVEQLLEVFPQADLYAVVDFMSDEERTFLGGRSVQTSFIQRLPLSRRGFRKYLPLMPIAVEQFDLSGYDLVITSNHAVAKGVITGPDQVHVSYVHTPIRYAWDLQHQYLNESGLTQGMKSRIARLILHYLRIWDSRTAHGVDVFIANSKYIARRINKTYGRQATVIYPPVDIDRFALHETKESFYLAASRMVPYKRMPMIVEAFAAMPDRQLVVIGDGPDMVRIKTLARGHANILVMGYQSDYVLSDFMARARALVFAAEEDFGITPVEAQACGTPVIAYGAGGAMETVISSPDPNKRTGVFFYQQTPEALRLAVEQFESVGEFLPRTCRANAERFGSERFRRHILETVSHSMSQFKCDALAGS